uniref:Eukaryotic translation initiation factor 4 gamma 3 n=1 Tax=Sipha flava TaxID=143950 RepID=A0A2S2QES7_9HEMI
MDSSSMICEKSTATKTMKRNMAMYCMNMMRKRTVDEQLNDLSTIMNCSLDLIILYHRNELEVSYRIGSQIASVNGLDESMCVRQCKRYILDKLQVFCGYTKIPVRTSSSAWQVRSDKSSELSSESQDVYSEIELCKKRVDGKVARKAFDENIVMVDPEMDIPGELCDYMSSNKLPLVLTISYFPTEWKMIFECGPYCASTDGSVNSTCMQQCKKLLLHELNAFVTNEKVGARKETISENQRCDQQHRNKINEPTVMSVDQPPEAINLKAVFTNLPVTRSNEQPRISCNIFEPHEEYVISASKVLKNVTWDTFQENASRFFDVILQTDRANRFYLKMITDCVVSNAIDNPDNCALYATLCCHVIENTCVDSRRIICQGLSSAFKTELIKSCRVVLTEAGVLLRTRMFRQPQARRSEQRFDVKARDRTHGTCRFMGELFMRDQIFKTVMSTIDTFMQIHDAHSLECLCVLLTIIAPKLEKVIDAPRQVYKQLKSYLVTGYAGNIPLPRQTIHMIDILLNMRKCNTKGSNSWRGDFTEGNTRKARNSRHQEVQSVDHRRNRISGENSRSSQNRSSYTTMVPVKHHGKHVTFNPVVSVFYYHKN